MQQFLTHQVFVPRLKESTHSAPQLFRSVLTPGMRSLEANGGDISPESATILSFIHRAEVAQSHNTSTKKVTMYTGSKITISVREHLLWFDEEHIGRAYR